MPKAYAAASLGQPRTLHRLVILTAGRSGSEALVTRLDSHPAMRCDSEILADRRRWPERLLQGRARLAQARGGQAYGFKLLPGHVHHTQRLADPGAFVHCLEGQGWLIVHLKRRNRLHQAISALRAHRTQYHYEVGRVPRFQPLRVDTAELLKVLSIYDSADREEAALLEGLDPLKLTYEDDLESPADQERTVHRIITCLGLKPAPTSTRQVRVNPTTVREMVANYDEVVDTLADGPYAGWLDVPARQPADPQQAGGE